MSPTDEEPRVPILEHVEAFPCQVGDRLGRYRLVQLLARGQVAAIFKAVHETLNREVAIKVLNAELMHYPMVLTRFFTEAQAVNRIRHPNIVEITDFVEGSDHPPYMVMELLEGEDLRDYLMAKGPLSPQQAISIAAQISDALDAAHKAGIVHRDLKAENIFLKHREGELPLVKLLDFGVAKWLGLEGDLPKTLTGEVLGTPEYMAPEQIKGEELDHRTDIYAMGVLLYEMLTDRLPFKDSRVGELLRMQMHDPPRPPSELLKDEGKEPLPKSLETVVLTCLAKNKEQRIQTMAMLTKLLRQLEDDTDVVMLSIGGSRHRTLRWLLPTAAATAALVSAITLVWWLGSWSNGERISALAGVTRPDPRAAETTGVARTSKAAPHWITSRPSAASVFRLSDGKFMGYTPVALPPGKSGQGRFLVRLKGYRQQELVVDAATRFPIQMSMEKMPHQIEHDEQGEGADQTRQHSSAEGPRLDAARKKESRKPQRLGPGMAADQRAREREPLLKNDYGIADPFK